MRTILPVTLALALGACTTINPDLTSAASRASTAAATAASVQNDILAAKFLGMTAKGNLGILKNHELALVVCTPPSNDVDVTAKDLGAFADAINMVGKIAAKPASTTYSGYLAQFKKNQDAINAAPPDKVQNDKDEKAKDKKAQALCAKLFETDIGVSMLQGQAAVAPADFAPAVASVVAVDSLIKAILAAGEQAQREIAVRKALSNLTQILNDAITSLNMAPAADDYILAAPAGKPETRFGNTFAIHRWFAAQRVHVDWSRIMAAPTAAEKWKDVDIFVTDSTTYQSLAAIDTDKIMTQLKSALDAATKNPDSASLGEILDGMSSVASALSGINNSYAAYRKTRN